MKKTIIPTFHIQSPFLTNPSDIIAYVIRQYLYTPSGIYENYDREQLTYAKQYADTSHSHDLMATGIQDDLTELLNRQFPNGSVMVEIAIVTDQFDKEQDYFQLSVSVIIDGITYPLNTQFSLSNDGKADMVFE